MIIDNFTQDMREFDLVSNTPTVSDIGEISRTDGSPTTIEGLLFRDDKPRDANTFIGGQVAVVKTSHKFYCANSVSAETEWFIVDGDDRYKIVDIHKAYFFGEQDHQMFYLVKIE